MNKNKKWDLIKEVWKFERDTKKPLTYDVFLLFHKIGRLSKKHKSVCVDYCNGLPTEQYEKLTDSIEAQIKTHVLAINTELIDCCVKVTFQHDPRGLTVKLYTDSEQFKSNEIAQYYYLLGLE